MAATILESFSKQDILVAPPKECPKIPTLSSFNLLKKIFFELLLNISNSLRTNITSFVLMFSCLILYSRASSSVFIESGSADL